AEGGGGACAGAPPGGVAAAPGLGVAHTAGRPPGHPPGTNLKPPRPGPQPPPRGPRQRNIPPRHPPARSRCWQSCLAWLQDLLGQTPDGMTGDCVMTEHTSGDPDADDRFVRLDDGDMHVVEDDKPDAPAVLLIHGTAGSTAWWDPVVPRLADAYRVIRVDLLGHGRSASPTDGYDIPTQARRVGAALDRLGAGRVAVIGHSTGGTVATALAEQRPDAVAALALIDTGPSSDAYLSQGLLPRLLLSPPPPPPPSPPPT